MTTRVVPTGRIGGVTGSVAASRGFYPVVLACFAGTLLCILLEMPIASLFLALVGVGALALEDLRALLVLAYPAYALLGVLASSVLIEGGAYITEQFRYGDSIGASAGVAAYGLAFLGLAHFLTTRLMRSIRPTPVIANGAVVRGVVLASCLLIGLFYTVAFLRYGTGFQFSDLRFGWVRSLSPSFMKIHSLLGKFLIPALFGLTSYYWVRTGRARLWFLALAVPIIAQILIGEKFSGFNSSIMVALAGIGIAAFVGGKQLAVRIGTVLLVLGVAATLMASILIGYRNMGSGDVVGSLINRIVLQGHVWYGTFDLFDGEPGVALSDLLRENSLGQPGGLDYLSYLISDPEFVYRRIAAGVSFTMGGAPSALAAFGLLPGLAVYTLLGTGYALNAWIVASSLSRGSVITATVALVYFMVLAETTQMGRWDTGYGTVALASYVVLLGAFALRAIAPRGSRASARLCSDFPRGEPV